ncbi:MAG: cellulase family glycosylhydrolase [Chloroflexota bacterium]|nr:cellulase family glycosylhydrolase [Chloroflexota bacterium]
MPITTRGRWFIDETGRTRILHGVNLSGSSKIPAEPPGQTHLPESLAEKRNVSFIGRPFPLEEADEHFGRLKHWGLDFLRFLVPWEAVEHAGPGRYDDDYLDYLEAVLEKALAYDINLFIDPHQDVWSRFSGGDGAPAWTFEAAGMDVERFHQTGAALLHQRQPKDFPHMLWANNYYRFAAFTMFTLFFGGRRFAPQLLVDGLNIQDFLQEHYVNAFAHVAKRIRHLPNVLGFDTMNEPHYGLIGVPDLRGLDHLPFQRGLMPTPAQAIFLANGFAQDCADFGSPLPNLPPLKVDTVRLDPAGATVWRDECQDIWRAAGIWAIDAHGKPRLLRPGHFARADFTQDHLKPFIERFRAGIHAVMPEARIFLEAEPFAPPPRFDEAGKLVYAPHFYDGMTLFTRRFQPHLNFDLFNLRPLLGEGMIRDYFSDQFGRFRAYADVALGDVPIVIGEFGAPMDLNGAAAYHSGDFSAQAAALDNNLRALDDHLLSYTLWNYTPDNSNEYGDGWNGEDLSIFSRDQQRDPGDIDAGGRALSAVVRPYARKVAGEPLNMRFDQKRGLFTFSFRHDAAVTEPTEIYVPNSQFPAGYRVEVSDGEVEVLRAEQRLLYRHSDKDMPHMIRVISNNPPPAELSPWDKLAIVGLIVALVLYLLGRRGGKSKKQAAL